MTEKSLLADQFQNDPRIQQARELLQSALRDHTGTMTEVRPPRQELHESYQATVSKFSELRGGKLFYPFIGTGFGRGPFVELADGSVKFDMITGIGVHVAGHNHPALLDTALNAALADTVMQGNLQQNLDSFALCRELVDMARTGDSPLQHCFLTTSGAMANENALKMLFQVKPGSQRLLAFENCFAGRSLVLSQVTDRPQNRVGLPASLAVDYIPFFDMHHPEASTAAALQRLDEYVARYPGAHAGMILELIQGEGGYHAAPREFLKPLLDRLREHSVPIWFDEIQTFGRTACPFAFQHLALEAYADMVTVGKMTQVCATLFRDDLKPQPGLISQTFTGATSSIGAARWILQQLREGPYCGLTGRTMQIHQRFVHHFEKLQADLPGKIAGPWGCGGMIAFTVGDGSATLTRSALNQLFDEGVVAFSAGSNPSRIRMLPPLLVITDEEVDAVCEILGKVLQTL